ncbi:MAG: hypothetical protein RJB47_635, partial [Pseudomonadota bacterium]
MCRVDAAGLVIGVRFCYWGQIPINSRLSRPQWGPILLLFRSQNGPQSVRLRSDSLVSELPMRQYQAN